MSRFEGRDDRGITYPTRTNVEERSDRREETSSSQPSTSTRGRPTVTTTATVHEQPIQTFEELEARLKRLQGQPSIESEIPTAVTVNEIYDIDDLIKYVESGQLDIKSDLARKGITRAQDVIHEGLRILWGGSTITLGSNLQGMTRNKPGLFKDSNGQFHYKASNGEWVDFMNKRIENISKNKLVSRAYFERRIKYDKSFSKAKRVAYEEFYNIIMHGVDGSGEIIQPIFRIADDVPQGMKVVFGVDESVVYVPDNLSTSSTTPTTTDPTLESINETIGILESLNNTLAPQEITIIETMMPTNPTLRTEVEPLYKDYNTQKERLQHEIDDENVAYNAANKAKEDYDNATDEASRKTLRDKWMEAREVYTSAKNKRVATELIFQNQVQRIRSIWYDKTSLRERLSVLFDKEGITIASIIFAISMTISTIVLSIANAAAGTVPTPGPGPTPTPTPTPGITDKIKEALIKFGNWLLELAKKSVAALPGLIGSIVSFILSTLGKTAMFLAEHVIPLLIAVVSAIIYGIMTYVKRENKNRKKNK